MDSGITTNKILSGSEVFHLVATHGLPLEIINLQLKEQNKAFNVIDFIDEAAEHWTAERTYKTLMECCFSCEAKLLIMEHIYKKCTTFSWGKNDKKTR